eukprot:scaffold1655_cov94-Isochrysis_galbana.AAC.2
MDRFEPVHRRTAAACVAAGAALSLLVPNHREKQNSPPDSRLRLRESELRSARPVESALRSRVAIGPPPLASIHSRVGFTS